MPRPQKHLAELLSQIGPGQLTSDGPVISLLKDSLIEARADEDERLELHVSDCGKMCDRQLFLRLSGVPKTDPLTADSLVNFKVGDAVEDVFCDALTRGTDGGVVRQLEFKINWRGHSIVGHCDVLAVLPDETGLTLIEVKSINSRGMSWMIKKGEAGKTDHRAQLEGYRWALQHHMRRDPNVELGYTYYVDGTEVRSTELPKREIARSVLVYIVKDATKGEPIGFETALTPDDEQVAREFTRLMRIETSVQSRQSPPPIKSEFKRRSFPCSYCAWNGYCWA